MLKTLAAILVLANAHSKGGASAQLAGWVRLTASESAALAFAPSPHSPSKTGVNALCWEEGNAEASKRTVG